MPQIKDPDDLQIIPNHPGFFVCMTIACYDGNKKKVCFHFHGSKRPVHNRETSRAAFYGQISKNGILPVGYLKHIRFADMDSRVIVGI